MTTWAIILLASAAAPMYDAELIFTPEPLHNHGSSIVELPNGDLLACWFHGSGERRSDDVMVLGARKRKGAVAWSEPFQMADSYQLPDCNPVLFLDPRGTLWLFWIAVQNNEWGGSLLKYRTSTDYDADGPPKWNWQDVIHCRPLAMDTKYAKAIAQAEIKYGALINLDPELKQEVEAVKAIVEKNDKLAMRLGWMTRLHPIMLSENKMMLGLYSDVFNCALAAFTEDWGKSWSFSEPICGADLGNIQPSFVKKKNGDIAAFMRDNGEPKRVRYAESKTGGTTWGDVRPLLIPNPGSSVECISLKNGHWVLVCNDTTDGRHELTAYLTEDEGANWNWKRHLEKFPTKDDGSASYPSVIQASDGTLHCTYSLSVPAKFKGSTIKHAQFTEDWIRAGD